MQQPIGENMPPVGIGTELDLVDRHEFRSATIERHRLHRAREPARIRRHDLFFAGD